MADCFLAAYMDRQKHRTYVAWLAISFFISPFVALLMLSAFPNGNGQPW